MKQSHSQREGEQVLLPALSHPAPVLEELMHIPRIFLGIPVNTLQITESWFTSYVNKKSRIRSKVINSLAEIKQKNKLWAFFYEKSKGNDFGLCCS